MKHLRLLLFNWITAAFLAVCVPVILFFASDLHPSGFCWGSNSLVHREYSRYGVGLYRGEISFGSWHETWSPTLDAPQPPFATTSEIDVGKHWFCSGETAYYDPKNKTGFAIYDVHGNIDGYIFFNSGLALPAYFVSFLLAIPAMVCIVRTIRKLRDRRLANSGICVKCGYDLRATPDRCPECGTIPPGRGIIST